MVDVSIVNETSPEANWNRQTDRQANLYVGRLRLQKFKKQEEGLRIFKIMKTKDD